MLENPSEKSIMKEILINGAVDSNIIVPLTLGAYKKGVLQSYFSHDNEDV